MKIRIIKVLAPLLLVLFPCLAWSTPVTLEWNSRIDYLTDWGIPQVPEDVVVGTNASGSFVFDTDASPSSLIGDYSSKYEFPTSSWKFNIGSHLYIGMGVSIVVTNDHPAFGDEILVSLMAPPTNDPTYEFVYLFDLRDFDATTWDSQALPGSYGPTQFAGVDFLQFTLSRLNTTFINVLGEETTGNISVGGSHDVANGSMSISPVPEPATMLLLGSGLIGLAAFRRRFRKT
jgi:hypothetical protein